MSFLPLQAHQFTSIEKSINGGATGISRVQCTELKETILGDV